jgi:crotonobetainyl-CoA:carnitine CoA-transferase CaiB-like acyl-CoA transferase
VKPPLAGVRLLSLAEQYPGPYATMALADLGADVINVERPAGGDPTRAFPGFWESLARGKRSVALDLKTAGGRAAFGTMVAGADVVLEGYRPGVVGRLGVDYETLRQVNDRLVYVSVSGFGQDGPYRDRPGHDLCYQALAGTLYGQLAGDGQLAGGGAPRPSTLELGDLTAGLLTVQAVLLGLVRRDRDGHGSYLDVSVFDGLVSLLSAHLGPVLNDTGTPGFPHEPGYAVYRTSDGALLALGVAHEDQFWRRLCALAGLESEQDLSSAQRLADRARLGGLLATRIATRTFAQWERLLTEADVPHSAVHDLAGVAVDPHTASRGLLVQTGPPGDRRRFVRQPLVVDGVGWGPQSGAPALGQHTTEVLGEAGLDDQAIAALLASGAAADPSHSAGSSDRLSAELSPELSAKKEHLARELPGGD